MGNKDRYNRHHQLNNNTSDEIVEELREEEPFESVEEIENENSITTVATTSDTDEPMVVSIEQKNEEVVTSGYIEPVEEDDNQKKIEQLKQEIENYEKEIAKSRNNTINVFYHDKIMEARKEITRLSSILPPIVTEETKAPTVSDRAMHKRRIQLENVNENIIRIF